MGHCRLASAAAAVLVLAGCDAGRPEWHADVAPAARVARARTLEEIFTGAGELERLHTLLVARAGEVVREERFRGAGPGAPANIKSASKSIVSALVGIAIAEGELEGVHQPIAPFFAAELRGDSLANEKRRITIGHLLSMQSGLEPTSFGNYGEWVSSANWVRNAVRRPLVAEPGGRMLYSTGSTHLLSAILTEATDRSTLAYARERLFRPLGIELRAWTTDPQGIYFGGNEMRLAPRELWKFGELYRNGGRWNGRQIVPESWIRESWTPRTVSRFNGHRYGYGWWIRSSRGHDAYFAWGYGGQYLFIVPDLELVVVTTSDAVAPRAGSHLRAVHQLLDEVVAWAEATPRAERSAG